MFDVNLFISKPYKKVLLQPRTPLLASELNEAQDSLNTSIERTNLFCGGDGPYGDSFKVSVSDNDTLSISKGFFVHLGHQLYIDNNVNITYDLSQLSLGESYILICTWMKRVVNYTEDSNIKIERFGRTSDREAYDLTFSIERESIAISALKNVFVLAKLNFRDDGSNLLSLAQTDISDSRLDYSIHYVNSGLDIESITSVGGYARVILTTGVISYLGNSYTVDDLSERMFDIPLAQSGTISRYLLYYYVENSNIYPTVVSYSNSSNLNHAPLKMFEISVDNLNVITDSINSIRRFEPISRTVARQSYNSVVVPNLPVTYDYNSYGDQSTYFKISYGGLSNVAPNGWFCFSQRWSFLVRTSATSPVLNFDMVINQPFSELFNYTLNSCNSYDGIDFNISLENFTDLNYTHRLKVTIEFNTPLDTNKEFIVNFIGYGY